ncbi:Non-reducing end alpha-L-arabinofuranosidase BoGH43B [Echria macrotheca]|uniref:Non-reducing end alpha-L-arabinofuranosidase BoGH43B n=1 Tax=Echria macrotheca TaxID=438768 RepID=A0AAJ0F1I5_9PEZI|nr:Non-reducing end alpha-L-arabinofuranosidase BoGH43B [Echria macrotheca]
MALARSLLSITIYASSVVATAKNTTFYNPILPGFHPDPSCIFVRDWNNTFFCASSSFNAFPGIPLHASQDLQHWQLIGHVLNRQEQLPRLAETNRSTSGIWAPTLRFHDNTFWLVTTLVDDDRPQADHSRWDNIIFKGKDPYNSSSWSNAIHFNFTGYDTEPFWDVDGTTYITGAHAWQTGPYIQLAKANLETGELGEWLIIWNGTGGMAPEGPHIYRKDGWYYLLAAEGGTGLGHMVTMARSRTIQGPYESNPENPVLTNTNTNNLFQTVGHADLFQDGNNNWWGVALSTRSGPEYINYPMGRETVLTAVVWHPNEFPVWTPISGVFTGWALPPSNTVTRSDGPIVNTPDNLNFSKLTTLPLHLTHWRYPHPDYYTLSPLERPDSLRLIPSYLNLTALNGNYAGTQHGPDGQTFIGRRQTDTLFTFSIDLSFTPTAYNEESGVSAFLTQNHHLTMGVALLPASESTTCLPGINNSASAVHPETLIPQVRFQAVSHVSTPRTIVAPLPDAWKGRDLTMDIRAVNVSHYAFSIGPTGHRSQLKTVVTASNDAVSWGFTGVILGVFATSNGAKEKTPAYVTGWRYWGEGQFRD